MTTDIILLGPPPGSVPSSSPRSQRTMKPNSALAQMMGIQTVAGSAARTMAFGMQGFRRFEVDDSYTVKSLRTYN